MIDVISVLWGDKYHKGYVYALKEAVEKNLTLPHTFKCITDHDLPGIETIKPICDYHGWWQKLSLFEIADAPTIYLDLDVVICGNIDFLFDYTKYQVSAPANWGQSGHGGIQSSVLCTNGCYAEPYRTFDYENDHKRLWGDQEYLSELRGDDFIKIPHVGSYKYHCRTSIPDDMRIIAFHGKPDPHEVNDPWILPYTQTLRSHINESTPVTLQPGLKRTA